MDKYTPSGFKGLVRMHRAESLRELARDLRVQAGMYSTKEEGREWVDNNYIQADKNDEEAENLMRGNN